MRQNFKVFGLVSFFALAFVGDALSQNELSNFSSTGRGGVTNTFARDYQSLGINPANLGRTGNYKVAFTLGEGGMGMSTQSLNKDQLKKFIWNAGDSLTLEDKQNFANAFANENAMNINVDLTTFAFSFQGSALGGLAFSNRHRVSSHIGLNQTFAEILFLGKNAPIYQNFDSATAPNISTIFDHTELQISWLDEYNIAYGHKVFEGDKLKLFAGVGYKYLRGIGILDLVIDDKGVTAFSALSPVFDTDYGSFETNPTFNYVTQSGGLPKSVGSGSGFDLGLAAEYGEKLVFSLAVTDIGSMEWDGNLLVSGDQQLQQVTSNGVATFNIFQQAAQFSGAGDEALLVYQAGVKRSSQLATRLRFGAGYLYSERLEAGFDFTAPLNSDAGNLPSAFVGAGIDYKPNPSLKLSTGISGGAGNGFSIPLGITFDFRVYEFGLGTRDFLGLFSEKFPYYSVSWGFLRFKFGKNE